MEKITCKKNLNYTVNFVSFFVHWKKLFYEQTHKPVRQSHTKMEQTLFLWEKDNFERMRHERDLEKNICLLSDTDCPRHL